jgi:hypothetical protein
MIVRQPLEAAASSQLHTRGALEAVACSGNGRVPVGEAGLP